jgi:chromosome segregation ATPase
MGIHRPDPTAKEGKYNCPLITFSELIRTEFYDLCEQQGVVIDHEVKNPSQKHLSVLEYKCQQMTAEVATLSAEKQQLEAVAAEQSQAIDAARAEIEEVRAERDTLRDQNSVSRTIQEDVQQPDRPIQAEYLPARKNLAGKVVEAEAVKISRSDYEWLRERAEKAERQTRADAITIKDLTRRAERAEDAEIRYRRLEQQLSQARTQADYDMDDGTDREIDPLTWDDRVL